MLVGNVPLAAGCPDILSVTCCGCLFVDTTLGFSACGSFSMSLVSVEPLTRAEGETSGSRDICNEDGDELVVSSNIVGRKDPLGCKLYLPDLLGDLYHSDWFLET